MIRRSLFPVLFAFGLHATAQTVFIPDANLRTWLNTAKPNSVDANGDCDTALWNAQPPYQVTFQTSWVPLGDTVDLEGIQHLKMDVLTFQGLYQDSVYFHWPGYPQNLRTLWINEIDVDKIDASLLPLPPTLQVLHCLRCAMDTIPDFNGTTLWMTGCDLSGQQTVPSSINLITLIDCNLQQLPSMPGATQLWVDGNPLQDWTNLPPVLSTLSVNSVGLALPPVLPSGLYTLEAADNGLAALPPLPATLGGLYVAGNQLASLPSAGPSGINALDVSHNPLTALPAWAGQLGYLNADSSGLLALPPWDPTNTVGTLSLAGTSITSVPPFPTNQQTLYEMDLRNCPGVTCLPALPASAQIVYLDGSGVTCLPNLPIGLIQNLLGIPALVCNPGNSPCPIVDPLITGTTFDDADADGVFDAGEAVRPNWMVEAQPGDLMAGSDANGNYVLPAGIGSYTVSAVPTLYWPPTNQEVVTFTALGQVDSLNHLGAVEIAGMYDLTTDITGSAVRPGFNTNVWVTVRNVGTEPTTADVQFTFDPALTYMSSSIAGNLNGNVLDWATVVLVPGEVWTVDVVLYGPPTLVLGDPVVHQATATQSQPDQTAADNTDVLNDVVVGSYDPNDKQVEPAFLSLADVAAGTRLHYTVRFQNTGTFMAERVLITDTLSSELHWTTINVEAASHAHTWYLHNGVLHVLFENINLPDSTSDEPGSHGFVKFSFIATNGLVTGDVVENIANIHFDFNAPIITNTASTFVNTALGVEAASGSGLTLWPVPATEVLWVQGDAPLQRVQLLDRTGRVVRDAQANGQRAALDVRDLSAGAYAVRCTTEQGVVQRMFVR